MELLLLVAIISLFWGLGDFFAKKASGKTSFWNYTLLTNISFLPLAYFAFGPTDPAGVPLLALVSAIYLACSYTFYKALQGERVSIVAPLSSTNVLLAIFLAVAVGHENFGPVSMAGALLAVAGVTLALLEDPTGLQTIKKETLALLAVTVAGWGTAIFAMKYLIAYYSPPQISFWISIIFAATAILALAKTREMPSLGKGGLFAVLAGLGWTLGMLMFNAAIESNDLSLVYSLSSFYPIVPFILGVALENEKVRKHQATGVLAMLAGIAIIYAAR